MKSHFAIVPSKEREKTFENRQVIFQESLKLSVATIEKAHQVMYTIETAFLSYPREED